MSDCVFCRIRDTQAENSLVHEDELVLAFMDLFPVNPGHVLVVPKEHLVGLEDVPDQVGARMWSTARRVGRALRAGAVRCEGVNLFLADGEAAFQEIFHVHLHVFPRFAGDPFTIDADWKQAERTELDAVAARLRSAMG